MENNIEFYIASKNGADHLFTRDFLAELSALIVNRSTFAETARYHVKTHQTVIIGDDYFRCCAKIAFNTLAHLKGKDLVLQECFNPIMN